MLAFGSSRLMMSNASSTSPLLAKTSDEKKDEETAYGWKADGKADAEREPIVLHLRDP
jgi:hypothetical protein